VPITKIDPSQVRSNNKQGNTEYNMDTIAPRCIRFEEKINERLMPMFDDRLFVMFDNPVGDDEAFALTERESNLKTGLVSINEERMKLGMEEVEWGKYQIMTTNSAPYDGTKPQPPAAPGGGGDMFGGEGDQNQNDSYDDGMSDETKEFLLESLSNTIAEQIIQARQ
jgi:hypothetical protein